MHKALRQVDLSNIASSVQDIPRMAFKTIPCVSVKNVLQLLMLQYRDNTKLFAVLRALRPLKFAALHLSDPNQDRRSEHPATRLD